MGRKKGNEWMGIEGKSDRISTAKLGESARTNPHTHTLKRTHGVREYIYIYPSAVMEHCRKGDDDDDNDDARVKIQYN
mgnify:CR=1 FL=1